MRPSAMPVTGNTEQTRPENRAFFPALDGIRAFAILAVFAHHYLSLEVGWVGVDIFFVLSGFLITGILFDTRQDAHRARNFYVRRSLRIFPLYYLIALVLLISWPIFHWQWDWRWISWPLYLANWVLAVHRGALDDSTTSLMNGWLVGSHHLTLFIGHFWSLCVEEQFYLVWPWVVFKVQSRRALIAISSAIIIVWPLLRYVADHHLPATMVANQITAHNTIFRLDTLMFGSLVALLYRGPGRAAMIRGAGYSMWIACIITAAALIAFAIHPALLHQRAVKPYLFSIGFTVIAFFSATLIVRALVPGTFLYRIFSNTMLRWMGRISYGAYVFHDIFHPALNKVGSKLSPAHASLATAAVGLALTFTLAWLSFRFFETPFLNLKERWTIHKPASA